MVRSFGVRDLWTVKQLQPRGVAFDLRRVLLYAAPPVASAVLGLLTRHRLGTITCVQDDSGPKDRCGFVQVSPRANGTEWDLTFLAPSLDFHSEAAQIWHELLRYLVVRSIEEEVMRIYARSSEDAEAEDILRQAGFTVVTREEVFVLAQQPAPAPSPRGLRRVERQDAWALEQLHRKAVPPQVQRAEGLTQRWCGLSVRKPMGTAPLEEFVWWDKGDIVAYLGLCGSSRGYWLEIVVRPEHRADLLPYIRYVLNLAECSHGTPVYCNVPDHAVGLGWLLRTIGFEPYMRQVVMVLHSVARVPVRRQLVIPSLERGVDVGTTIGHLSRDVLAGEQQLTACRGNR